MKFKATSLIALSKQVTSHPMEIWRILAGGTTEDLALAKGLQSKTGISAQVLMFTEAKTFRPGALEFVADYLKISKTHAHRLLYRKCQPGPASLERLVSFSGIEERFWLDEKHFAHNWMFSRRA